MWPHIVDFEARAAEADPPAWTKQGGGAFAPCRHAADVRAWWPMKGAIAGPTMDLRAVGRAHAGSLRTLQPEGGFVRVIWSGCDPCDK
jgi:hypothetical protein